MKSDSPEVKRLKEKFGPGELTPEQREELRLAEIAAGKGKSKSSISGLMKALSSPPAKAEEGMAAPVIPPAPKLPKIDMDDGAGKMPHSVASPLRTKK